MLKLMYPTNVVGIYSSIVSVYLRTKKCDYDYRSPQRN